MVVDDNEMVRRSTCGLLKSYPDIEVVCEGADGAEAVTKARGYRPDVILMDITMPTMNGLEATRIIKSEIPGHSDCRGERARCRSGGAIGGCQWIRYEK